MLEWKNYAEISTIEHSKALGKHQSGVYRVRLAKNSGNSPITIARFRGKDKEGLISIGESVDLRRRIKEFYRSYAYPDNEKHSSCFRLALYVHFTNQRKQSVNVGEVQYSYAPLAENEIQETEAMLLAKYFRDFGELPPLNSNVPGKFFGEMMKLRFGEAPTKI